MRRLFTTGEALSQGVTAASVRWGVRTGKWCRIERGVYGLGPDEPTPIDVARAAVLSSNGVASGLLAGVLHGLDSVALGEPEVVARNGRRSGVRRRHVSPARVIRVAGVPCTDGLQTVLDLAALLSDRTWEQALESAIRKKLFAIPELEEAVPTLDRSRSPRLARVRRVLARRPPSAPPTESLLETLMVQLARTVRRLSDPVRQLEVEDNARRFVARVDLAWPALGLFVELDGQHHRNQPVYDSWRETAIVAATGWLCGRFTWTEVVRHPNATSRRLSDLAEQAARRPLASNE